MQRILRLPNFILFIILLAPMCYFMDDVYRPFVRALTPIFYGIWLYAIVYYGNRKLTDAGKEGINLKRFNMIALIYSLALVVLFVVRSIIKVEIDTSNSVWAFVVIGGHACVVITTSQVILRLEGKEDAGAIDYIFLFGFIFTIWLGAAWVQPRVRKIFKHPKRVLIPNTD